MPTPPTPSRLTARAPFERSVLAVEWPSGDREEACEARLAVVVLPPSLPRPDVLGTAGLRAAHTPSEIQDRRPPVAASGRQWRGQCRATAAGGGGDRPLPGPEAGAGSNRSRPPDGLRVGAVAEAARNGQRQRAWAGEVACQPAARPERPGRAHSTPRAGSHSISPSGLGVGGEPRSLLPLLLPTERAGIPGSCPPVAPLRCACRSPVRWRWATGNRAAWKAGFVSKRASRIKLEFFWSWGRDQTLETPSPATANCARGTPAWRASRGGLTAWRRGRRARPAPGRAVGFALRPCAPAPPALHACGAARPSARVTRPPRAGSPSRPGTNASSFGRKTPGGQFDVKKLEPLKVRPRAPVPCGRPRVSAWATREERGLLCGRAHEQPAVADVPLPCRCPRAGRAMKSCGMPTATSLRARCSTCTPSSTQSGRASTAWLRPAPCTQVWIARPHGAHCDTQRGLFASRKRGRKLAGKLRALTPSLAGNFRDGQLEGAGTVTMPNGSVTVGACMHVHVHDE